MATYLIKSCISIVATLEFQFCGYLSPSHHTSNRSTMALPGDNNRVPVYRVRKDAFRPIHKLKFARLVFAWLAAASIFH